MTRIKHENKSKKFVGIVQRTFVLLLVLHVAKGRKERGIEIESDRSERNRSIKIPFFSRYYKKRLWKCNIVIFGTKMIIRKNMYNSNTLI